MVPAVVPCTSPEYLDRKNVEIKGEFLTVSLLEEKGYDPLIYRFFCLQSHYRKALVFTWENLDNAKIAYDKLIARIAALNPENGSVDEASMSVLKKNSRKHSMLTSILRLPSQRCMMS